MEGCELKHNSRTIEWYENEYPKIENPILSLKLAKPALRALINASIYSVDDLKKTTIPALEKLHGMGPGSVKKLKLLLV